MNLEQWMPEARQLAAQCWCDDETKDRVMDPPLAEAVARRIAAWMDDAARYARNEEYYRGLVQRCGAVFGEAAYLCDDGVSRSQDILCAKVPELVEALSRRSNITFPAIPPGTTKGSTMIENTKASLRPPAEGGCMSARELTPEEIGLQARNQALLTENRRNREQLENMEKRIRATTDFMSDARRAAVTRITEAIMWMEREGQELAKY
ncbi:MAG TPA: hypothetical protein VGF13_01165 [Verrucomicrobiae bacterium]